MTTVRDLITLALKDAGVLGIGQTAMAEDTNDSLLTLNGMLKLWNRRRWLVPSLRDTAFTATGAISYTVGTGGNFNIARPSGIKAAYARQLSPGAPNQVDYNLVPLMSREDYAQITLKQLASFPQYYFYDNAFPTGNLFVWPLPSSLYEIHIVTPLSLDDGVELGDDVSTLWPPEYEEAVRWNLAVRLRPQYQLPADPTITKLAKIGLNTIKTVNAQIPTLDMPADMVGTGVSYNVYSDQ